MLLPVLTSLITKKCMLPDNMRIEQTPLQDCLVVHDKFFRDERGYFFESFNKKRFNELTGLNIDFVQDNQSRSGFGVLRGLHFQRGEYAQAKLVRVLEGKVLDVVVDIRKNSPSFGKTFCIELSDNSETQVFIPRGCAHGFIVLSEMATFFYKCDNYYNKDSEGGIAYNDSDLNIDWKVSSSSIILSEKDKAHPTLKQIQGSL
jgi:dTDP-4-dehydrorhamnose 3,5-epimerase